MNFYSKNFKVLSKCIKVKSEKSKTLLSPLPSKNPEIKPTQSHLLVISFEDGSQSFLFSILSSFIKNLLINKIAEGKGNPTCIYYLPLDANRLLSHEP